MVDFIALLEEAWMHEKLHRFAIVPFLVSFAYVTEFRRLARIDGTHFGVAFGFPQPIATVWTFVNVPHQGSGVNLPPPSEIVLYPVVAVVLGVVAAGYLGSIDAGLDGEYDVLDAVRAYGVPLIGYEFVHLTAIALLAGVALFALPLAVVLLVVLVVAAYLFYAAPYLVVAADVGLVEGFRRSYAFATEGGAYLSFFVKYLVAVGVVSLVATPLIVNAGVPGAVLGAVVLALPALILNVATMLFVRSIIEPPQMPTAPDVAGTNAGTGAGAGASGQSNIPVDM